MYGSRWRDAKIDYASTSATSLQRFCTVAVLLCAARRRILMTFLAGRPSVSYIHHIVYGGWVGITTRYARDANPRRPVVECVHTRWLAKIWRVDKYFDRKTVRDPSAPSTVDQTRPRRPVNEPTTAERVPNRRGNTRLNDVRAFCFSIFLFTYPPHR